MSYMLQHTTAPDVESPKENNLFTKLSSSLDNIKRRYIKEDEQHYSTRLLRLYKDQHVIQELREAGLTNFDLRRRESRHIVQYLHRYEHVKAAVRGRLWDDGWGLLVATNLRVIFLHEIPFFTNMDEISYELVSGVTHNQVSNWYASITLHTRSKDYELNFVNREAALTFADFIEQMSIDRKVIKADPAKQTHKIRSSRSNRTRDWQRIAASTNSVVAPGNGLTVTGLGRVARL